MRTVGTVAPDREFLPDGTNILVLQQSRRPRKIRAKRQFTIYDKMEFEPYEYQPFPRMLYHPAGMRSSYPTVDKDGALRGKLGPFQAVFAETEAEVELMLKQGWHVHPKDAAEAERARLGEREKLSEADTLGKLAAAEQENEALKRLLLGQADKFAEMQKQIDGLTAGAKPTKHSAQVA